MLVPIINVKALSYVSDESVTISSNYHDFFNNYFSGKKSYLYFPYSCNQEYNRTCYYGIDSDNNYIKIYYLGSGYSYNQLMETGVDENFSVSGKNVIRKDVDSNYVNTIILVFSILFFVESLFLGGFKRD